MARTPETRSHTPAFCVFQFFPSASDMLPECFYQLTRGEKTLMNTGAEEVNRTPDLLITNLSLKRIFYPYYSITYLSFFEPNFLHCRHIVG
jgi:hypothetical protein